MIRRAVAYPTRSLRRWLRRHALRRQIAAAQRAHSLRVIVGSAGLARPGWILTDIDELDLLDRETWTRFLSPASIDALLAEHVWEHLSAIDGLTAACTCYHFLKRGAYLRVAVPDGFHPDPNYIEYVRPGGTGAGADDHKVLYDHESLSAVFSQAGFSVSLLEYFDANGTFHPTDWDPDAGLIVRSARYDKRNRERPLSYTSLIIDAYKPK